jgi:hypothetical protein
MGGGSAARGGGDFCGVDLESCCYALSYLASGALHRPFASHASRRDGPTACAAFVAEGKGVRLWENSLRAQRRRWGESLSWYLERCERNQAIAEACSDGGHTDRDRRCDRILAIASKPDHLGTRSGGNSHDQTPSAESAFGFRANLQNPDLQLAVLCCMREIQIRCKQRQFAVDA